MEKRKFRFAVIGLGMMGREFASAAARWVHLQDEIAVPEIVGVCSATARSQEWFLRNVPSVRYATTDYRELLDKADVDAVYVATPHNLHERCCIDALRAGKHVICEKPFGIDRVANESIYQESLRHPELIVRCASQMIYFPGARRMLDWLRSGCYGRILEMKIGFKHESDIDPLKPINWKRQRAFNGEYGVMGDLAPHALHLPLRAGVEPESVYAILSDIVHERPDRNGRMVPCDTWDNAQLLMRARMRGQAERFPLEMEVARIAPGSPNDWYIEIYGSEASARYSLADISHVYFAQRQGGSQHWTAVEVGYDPVYPCITGGMAAFGFCDALMQMWAAYLDELSGNPARERCMTPEEALVCHRILDGALKSNASGSATRL